MKNIETTQTVHEQKEILENRIIDFLIDAPEEIETDLISALFSFAGNAPSEEKVSSFQVLWYILIDAKKLKQLNEVSANDQKDILKHRIIDFLTDAPEEIETNLISAFFSLAGNAPSDSTISNFQVLWYILVDAKKLKQLM